MKKQSKPWWPFDLNADGKMSFMEKVIMFDEVQRIDKAFQEHIQSKLKSHSSPSSSYYSPSVISYWRNKYSRDDIDPYDYSSEAEYLEALNAFDEIWHKEYAEEAEKYHLDTKWYSSKKQFLEALNREKYDWRGYYRLDYLANGINPNDYETEEEYVAAVNSKQDEGAESGGTLSPEEIQKFIEKYADRIE